MPDRRSAKSFDRPGLSWSSRDQGSIILGNDRQSPSSSSPWAADIAQQTRRPHPSLGSVSLMTAVATSSYHGLRVKMEKKFVQGFGILSCYTFSKAMSICGNGFGMSASPQNSRDLSAERALSAFHRRHNFVISYVYELHSKIGRWREHGGERSVLAYFKAGRSTASRQLAPASRSMLRFRAIFRILVRAVMWFVLTWLPTRTFGILRRRHGSTGRLSRNPIFISLAARAATSSSAREHTIGLLDCSRILIFKSARREFSFGLRRSICLTG